MYWVVFQNGVKIENVKVQLQAGGGIVTLSTATSFEMLTYHLMLQIYPIDIVS